MKKHPIKTLILSSFCLALVAAGCTTTATVTPNPSPSMSPMPTPTVTPTPTEMPTMSPTPSPTVLPSPTPTPLMSRNLFGIDANNGLYRFSSLGPSTINNTMTITGLQPGEKIVGIAYRLIDKKLYGVGNSSRLYTIDKVTGVATSIGGQFSPILAGTVFGVSFDPVTDRIRVVSDGDQNLRLNPVTGAVALTDTPLSYADGDPNSGANPNLVTGAYTNNFDNATSTVLYAIDTDRDTLVKLNTADNGKINTVGALGLSIGQNAGLAIDNENMAWAALNTGAGPSALYKINLTTGSTSIVENIGTPNSIIGLAVEPIS